MRYETGVASQLDLLDAQRSLFALAAGADCGPVAPAGPRGVYRALGRWLGRVTGGFPSRDNHGCEYLDCPFEPAQRWACTLI